MAIPSTLITEIVSGIALPLLGYAFAALNPIAARKFKKTIPLINKADLLAGLILPAKASKYSQATAVKITEGDN